MAKITGPDKATGEQHTASEYNATKSSINSLYDALYNLGIISTIKTDALPESILTPDQFETLGNGSIGIKTAYLQSVIGQTSAENYLKSLPGFELGIEKILYGGSPSGFGWGPVPSGSLPQLGNTTLTLGTPSVNSIPLSWTGVTDATSYQVQRADNDTFTGATMVYNAMALSFAESTLEADKDYWYRVRAAASGFTPGAWSSGTKKTAAAGNITPAAPTAGVVNDSANTFDWTNSPGLVALTDYEYSIDGGTTISNVTAKPIVVGNVDKAPGQVCVRVKASSGRNASAWLFNQTAFTVTLITPAAPTNGVVDDTNDTWAVNPPSGYVGTDLETSIDGGTTYTANTSNVFQIGNVDLAIGLVKTRVKAGPGRNPGATLSNSVAFTKTIVGTPVPITAPVEILNMTFANSGLTVANLGNNRTAARFREYLPATADGYIQGEAGGIQLTFSVNPGGFENNASIILSRNPANNKVEAFIDGGNGMTLVENQSGPLILKISLLGATILFQYSIDNGVTFTGNRTAARPAGIDYYVKAYYGNVGDTLNNIKTVGLSLNNSLT